jgi:hypothetical protein
MQGTVGRIVIGFISGALAVVVIHELIVYVLGALGLVDPNRLPAWSMRPIPPYGVPDVLNRTFWGGLWGVLFALLYDWVPGGMAWLKGLVFGLLVLVFSTWLLVPFIKGQIFGVTSPPQVYFGNFDPRRMIAGVFILGGFGIALGVLYALLSPRRSTA